MKRFIQFLVPVMLLVFIVGCISPEIRTARIAINEKDYDRALKSALAEIERIPESAEAYYLAGYCYEMRRSYDYQKMTEYYGKSLEHSDQFASKIKSSREKLTSRYIQRALNYADSDTGDVDLALANLDTALIINEDILIYQQGAVLAFNAKMYDRAIEFATDGMQMEEGKEDLTLYQVMLGSSRGKGKTDEVIEWAKRIMSTVDIETDSNQVYLTAFDDLVMAYAKLGEHEAAQKATSEAMMLFPDRVDIKKNLAIFMIKREDYEGAMNIYKDVLKQNPDDFDANVSVGTVLANQDKFLEAVPYLEKAYEIDPTNIAAVRNLMAAYYNSDQFDKGAKIKEVFDKLTQDE
ncbi:tetratricopeptide repeat protein [Calditrichota bacterium]